MGFHKTQTVLLVVALCGSGQGSPPPSSVAEAKPSTFSCTTQALNPFPIAGRWRSISDLSAQRQVWRRSAIAVRALNVDEPISVVLVKFNPLLKSEGVGRYFQTLYGALHPFIRFHLVSAIAHWASSDDYLETTDLPVRTETHINARLGNLFSFERVMRTSLVTVRVFRAIARAIKTERRNGVRLIVLHLHAPFFPGFSFASVAAGFVFKVPVIITAHGATVGWRDGDWYERLHSLWQNLIHLSATMLGVSRASLNGRWRGSLIGSAVDSEFYRPELGDGNRFRQRYGLPPRTPILFYPARITELKGQKDLVLLASMLKARRTPAHIVMMGHGSGAYSKEVRQMVIEKDVSDVLTILPSSNAEDVRDGLAAAQVVVFPSRREAMPLGILEAAAMGVPVVGYDVPGVNEAVVPGVTGFLAPEAKLSRIASLVTELLLNPPLRRDLGAQARQRVVREFSADVLAERHLAWYAKALYDYFFRDRYLTNSVILQAA